jgi:hypothetical protein
MTPVRHMDRLVAAVMRDMKEGLATPYETDVLVRALGKAAYDARTALRAGSALNANDAGAFARAFTGPACPGQAQAQAEPEDDAEWLAREMQRLTEQLRRRREGRG